MGGAGEGVAGNAWVTAFSPATKLIPRQLLAPLVSKSISQVLESGTLHSPSYLNTECGSSESYFSRSSWIHEAAAHCQYNGMSVECKRTPRGHMDLPQCYTKRLDQI